jgi:hypothetical protein
MRFPWFWVVAVAIIAALVILWKLPPPEGNTDDPPDLTTAVGHGDA